MTDSEQELLSSMWSLIGIKGIQYYIESRDIDEEHRLEAKRQLKLRGYVALEDETERQKFERELTEAMNDKWEATPIEDMVAYLNYPLATSEGQKETVRQMGLRGYKAVLEDNARPALCSDFAEKEK